MATIRFKAKRSLPALPCAALLFFTTILVAECGNPASTPRIRSQDATFLILDQRDQPVARVRVGSLFQDYQTHWYFRIGVLPAFVCQDVRLEMIQTNILAETFSAITRRLRQTSAKQGLELRKFSLFNPGGLVPCLESARVRLDAQGRWKLSGGVRLRLDNIDRAFTEGTVSPLPDGGVQFSAPGPSHPFLALLFPPEPFTK